MNETKTMCGTAIESNDKSLHYWIFSIVSAFMAFGSLIGYVYIDYMIGEPIGFKIGTISLLTAIFASVQALDCRK